MFYNIHRRTPRCNNWVPLSTQQYRLRSLFQILAVNVGVEDLEGKVCMQGHILNQQLRVQFYYTLHSTALSAPFYTSEKIESSCPKWKEINYNPLPNSMEIVIGNSDALVIRLWMHTGVDNDELITVWGIRLSGLVFLGQQMLPDVSSFKANTFILRLPGGYFTNPEHFSSSRMVRHFAMTASKDDVRFSYHITALEKLQRLQKNIRDKSEDVNILKQKILNGDFVSSESRVGSAILRKLLSKNKPKFSYTNIAKLKESVEIARFRVQTLDEEKKKVAAKLRAARERIEMLADKNQVLESKIMEKYRLLQREIYSQREWRKAHVDRKEALIHCRARLNYRIKQLTRELCLVYPLEWKEGKLTICNVHLPRLEGFAGEDELQLSVALGFVSHIVVKISAFLDVPLRYPVIHLGSRSKIVDFMAPSPTGDREFPLFSKGKEKLHFHHAVHLLNKNIAQLRSLCDPTNLDYCSTLANLASLLSLTGPDESNDQICSPSSSTQDLRSSTLSFVLLSSSPVDHSFTPKKLSYCVSDSDFKLKPSVPRHRSTKSDGSVSDFDLDAPLRNPEDNEVLPCNLSYSLDKGLNELKENKVKTSLTPSASDSLCVPFPFCVADPAINSNLSRQIAVREVEQVEEELSKALVLSKNLEANGSSQERAYSFGICEGSKDTLVNVSNPHCEQGDNGVVATIDVDGTYLVCDKHSTSEYIQDESLDESFPNDVVSQNNDHLFEIKSSNPFDSDNMEVENYESAEVLKCGEARQREDEILNVVSQKNDDLYEIKTSNPFNSDNLEVENYESVEVLKCGEARQGEDEILNNESALPSDPLLDNVTNRTDALTRQSSSFNMFRSRFKSTLGAGNE